MNTIKILYLDYIFQQLDYGMLQKKKDYGMRNNYTPKYQNKTRKQKTSFRNYLITYNLLNNFK